MEDILEEAGLTMEAVKAETLVVYLDDFERIERLIASAEARRNAMIMRNRSPPLEVLAEALRQAAEEVDRRRIRERSRRPKRRPSGVTSPRRIRANRANARSSSGPKSLAGKTRSARNAFRHGFNVPVALDPDLAGRRRSPGAAAMR